MVRKLSTAALVVAVLISTAGAQADPWKSEGDRGKGKSHKAQSRSAGGPPPWAPAHGYRHKKGTVQYEAPEVYERRTREFGIYADTCYREQLGAVLGGAVGGAVGSRVGDREDRAITTVAGVVIGVLIGREIGRRMDEADQACVGQVLERAADHQTVRWRNPGTGVEYLVTPQQTYTRDERYCRSYTTVALMGGARDSTRHTACRTDDGAWRDGDP